MSSILWQLSSQYRATRQDYRGWSAQRVVQPVAEPVDLAMAKAHCRVTITEDDALIESYIATAREHCELICNRSFITQTWDFWLPIWPASDRIRLPFPPLQTVDVFEYVNSAETAVIVDPSTYVVRPGVQPGYVTLRFAQIWPTDVLSPSWPIRVRFRAGYGIDATTVPKSISQAILMLVGHWYENREAVVVGRSAQIATEIMFAVDRLLSNYRTEQFGFSQNRTYDPLGL